MKNEIIKVQSSINYGKGTILYDGDTGEAFKVLDNHRISIFGDIKYGLTLEQL